MKSFMVTNDALFCKVSDVAKALNDAVEKFKASDNHDLGFLLELMGENLFKMNSYSDSLGIKPVQKPVH